MTQIAQAEEAGDWRQVLAQKWGYIHDSGFASTWNGPADGPRSGPVVNNTQAAAR